MSDTNIPMARRGLMLILSSPSGAGKSTIARRLLEIDDDIELSVSVTTRARRPSEVDGRDYHFLSKERFERMRDDGDLLEWARVHDNYYGTPREPVEKALVEGRDVLFDIDWQGTQQLAEAMRDDVVRVFILPPTMEELRQRLERRAEDDPDVIARRLKNSRGEIDHWTEYEFVIVNEDVQRSLEKVRAIVNTERLRRSRQTGLADFVDELLAQADRLNGD